MYERRTEKLLPLRAFQKRVFRHGLLAGGAIFCALAIGVWGYHYLARLDWVDAFLNASMILAGMGPVNSLPTTASKIFAACYALFSGLVFIGAASVLMAPFLHRLMHRFHIEKP